MELLVYEKLAVMLSQYGMILHGGFHAADDTELPEKVQTTFLVGNAGPGMFRAFSASDFEGSNALDRWTSKALRPIAEEFQAEIVFPFDGLKYAPFQRWAQLAEELEFSPLGILLHPHFGLWHAYRAALIFNDKHKLPPRVPANHFCEECTDKPCLHACPVSAFSGASYDVDACRGHLAGEDKQACMKSGCASRRACPVGQEYTYSPEQAVFHMQAFRS